MNETELSHKKMKGTGLRQLCNLSREQDVQLNSIQFQKRERESINWATSSAFKIC